MKPKDIEVLPKVGQYWLVPGSKVPSKVISIENNLVRFTDDYTSTLDSMGGFIYLWYTCEFYITHFSEATPENPPRPGQIWVNDNSQDILFIHPDQTGCENSMFRILSDSSNVHGKLSLFSFSDKEDQDISIQ
jgi:hypothetical protein